MAETANAYDLPEQLTSSTRYSESRQAYREAQERHQEILRIEQNIAELAQLMNDVCASPKYQRSLR
jgi:syntaxin 1B/2/3